MFGTGFHLEVALTRAEKLFHALSILSQIGSGFMAFGATYLHLDPDGTSWASALPIAALVGAMTLFALLGFTAATINILPRLRDEYQAKGVAAVVIGMICFTLISGTANSTLLAHHEAQELDAAQYVTEISSAFQDAHESASQIAQLLPTLAAGREVAGTMRRQEEKAGSTGTGQGPVYAALISHQTRLMAAENELTALLADVQPLVRQGQDILERLRATMKDRDASEEDKQRALENAIDRLSAVSTDIRKKIPLASLRALAAQLRKPLSLPRYAADPDVRRAQEEEARAIQAEFEPIGTAIDLAVTDIEDRTTRVMPAYERRSPTLLVFRHADDLWFMIGVGYALDGLCFLSVALILIAHRQVRSDRVSPQHLFPAPSQPAPSRVPRAPRRGNGAAEHPGEYEGAPS